MFDYEVNSIRKIFKTPESFIPLHEPRFWGTEKEILSDTIDSTFVSSVGKYVDQAEEDLKQKISANHVVLTMNGTAALHMCLKLAGVERGDSVLTQALTFVATCNAISYLSAKPALMDVSRETLNITPKLLNTFLADHCNTDSGLTTLKSDKSRLRALVVMHTFGFPAQIDEIAEICRAHGIVLIEDAAESLGSTYKGKHLGTFGDFAAISFNGNKIITSGGGGAIVCKDEQMAKKAKHLTTTAKVPHAFKFVHDEIAYNYRMPNLNAALLCSQIEQLDYFVEQKRKLALKYSEVFSQSDNFDFFLEGAHVKANYWLNVLLAKSDTIAEEFLISSNKKGVMCRPVWNLMADLEIYKDCFYGDLSDSRWLSKRLVNIPSSVLKEI